MNILGIHDGHGASAALLVDGIVKVVIEEERLVREKNCSGYPKKAVEYLKSVYPAEMNSLDGVAVATKHHDFSLYATKRYPRFGIADWLYEERCYWKPLLVDNKKLNYLDVMAHKVDLDGDWYPLRDVVDPTDRAEIQQMRRTYIANDLGFSEDALEFVDHHTCHAHHAYFSSPIRQNAMIVTIDGAGDFLNCTVNRVGKDGRIENLYRTGLCNIGRVYQYVTQLLGMKPAEHEYKVMGLAAYAKEHYIKEPLEIFEDTYYVDGLQFKIDNPIKNHYQYFKEKLEGYRFDAIAGALQRWTENLLCNFIANWVKETGLKNIVFSGGVALNIKASKRLSELECVDDIFVSMASGDESISLGAAQYLWKHKGLATALEPVGVPFLSAGYSSDDIEAAIHHPYVSENYFIERDVSLSLLFELSTSSNRLGSCSVGKA